MRMFSTNPSFPDVTLSISPDKELPSGWTLVLLVYMMMLEDIEVIEDVSVPQQAHENPWSVHCHH
jgi:hypothetical protein